MGSADSEPAFYLFNLHKEKVCAYLSHQSKTGGTLWIRVRVGDYRILYFVDYSASKIYIEKIDKRGKVYG